MRRKRKCKVDSLFDLLTWKYRPLISAFHDFYDSWSLPYLEVTRRGECEMVLEKASPGHDFILPYRVREPEGQRTRAEPEPGERNSLKQGGNIEPRNEKGTSFNPISQLEFRIKRSRGPPRNGTSRFNKRVARDRFRSSSDGTQNWIQKDSNRAEYRSTDLPERVQDSLLFYAVFQEFRKGNSKKRKQEQQEEE